MRAELIRESGRVIKKVDASPYLFRHLTYNLKGYRDWLHDAGFRTPETQIQYSNGQVVFEQEEVVGDVCLNVESVIGKIRRLSFNTYGMDSNPHNFLGNGEVSFVDFFPLLTRDTQALDHQFDYSSQEALQRYFTLENILMFYVVRMFKEDGVKAMRALMLIKDDLITSYDTVLPREKVRLMRALHLYSQDNIDDYPTIYTATKKVNLITEQENLSLYEKLKTL